MTTPLSELLDRYSILLLKFKRLPKDEKITHESARYHRAIVAFNKPYKEWLHELYSVNGQIWDLEADIRKGKEGELGLEEVGRRALAIRDLNAKRIAIKNRIAHEMVEFEEIKVDHASA